jgi:tRNA pseudouridine65 synthase
MIPVVYEDDYCLVVNKPSNRLVHHSHFARNIDEQSVMEWVKGEYSKSAAPVHRLDRKTSGLLLIVKDKGNVARFQELFESESIQKVYWALVRGHVSDEAFLVDSPVKNERGNYREAKTWMRCLEKFERAYKIPPYPTHRYSLIEMKPLTGRYHQLRLHANKIAHPIINDPKHGNRHHNHYFEEKLGIPELFLHARSLEFTHPITGTRLALHADLPHFWRVFFDELVS